MDDFKYNSYGMSLVCNIVREEPNEKLEDLMNRLRELRTKLIADVDSPEEIHRINQFIAAGVALAKNNSGTLDFDEFNDLLHIFLFQDDDYIV